MNSKIIWFELAAFITSLISWPVIRNSRHLRIYPLLLLIVVIVEGYYTFFSPHPVYNAPVYNVQVPLQYICYLLILYYAARSERTGNFLKASLIILIMGNLVSDIFFTPAKYNNVWGYSLCSIIAIIGIVLKLYEMATSSANSGYDFLKDPFFYMLFAYLCFNLITLPYFAMSNWIRYTDSYDRFKELHTTLLNMMSICNYILYTTYSIAFLWIARRKVIY